MAATGQQQQTGVKPAPRSGHIAAIDGDSMFIWGGFSEYVDPWVPNERYQLGTDVWVYHALIDRWYKKKTEGDIPPGTSGSTAVIIDNELYIIGGHTATGNTSTVYCLNLHQWKWTRMDSEEAENSTKMSPRDKFTAWDYNSRIYVFGGFGVPITDYMSLHGDFYRDTTTWPVRGWNNQLLIFDPQLKAWSNPAIHSASPSPRAAHATVQFKNRVFMFGGRHNQVRLNDLHCLDLDKLRWSGGLSVPGDVPSGRSWHSFDKVSETHAVLYGGYTQEGTPLSDGWLFDSGICQWTQLALPEDRHRLWHTGASTPDGDVIIFGGCTNDILSEESSNHTNEIIVIRCCVKSLVRLCLDAAYEHHEVLQKEWTSLPKPLCNILQLRLAGLDNDAEATLGHNTKACIVS